jgi:hypothetical protein
MTEPTETDVNEAIIKVLKNGETVELFGRKWTSANITDILKVKKQVKQDEARKKSKGIKLRRFYSKGW